MNRNSWHPNDQLNFGSLDERVYWMTTDLPGGWRVSVRLFTDRYRTVVDGLHIEAGEDTELRGIRGSLQLPAGDPRKPDWQRHPIAGLRRQASAALETLLRDFHRTSIERHAAQARGEPPPSDRREPRDRVLAAIAFARGFTVSGTHPVPHAARQPSNLNLAIAAAAYSDAVQTHPRRARQGTQQRLDQIQRHYAPSTIGPLITKARNEGYLTPTAPGAAGGHLTPKAQQILADAHFQAPWHPPRPPKATPKTPKTAPTTVAHQSPTTPPKTKKSRTPPQSQPPPSSS